MEVTRLSVCLVLTGLLLGWTAACSTESHERRAELTARRLLAESTRTHLASREADARRPRELPPPVAEVASPASNDLAREVLDLPAALRLAFDSSRSMQDSRESLEADALALASVRHGFAPQLAMSLAYALAELPGDADANAGTASFDVSQILPTGGRLTLSAASASVAREGDSPAHDSLLSASLVQPLLRGGGYAVTHEPLIQAERTLVYSLREFELFREDFSIDVARRYYDLVNRKQAIENQRRNQESNEFARRQAEALFAVGRANELDVLRARRSELQAKNGLLEAQEGLDLALDSFRIFLGLPPEQPIDVQPEAPPFTPVHYELESALEVARENRLDLLNRREQLEDVERNVRLAADTLRPDLDLVLGTSYATDDSADLLGTDIGRTDTSLALTLGIPLDRVRERNAYRTAKLGLARARRDLTEFEDQLRVSIQSSFRELERRVESLEIQEQLIEDQTKNLRIAELRFERGEIPNRDVVEASQSLLDAENARIDEQVAYEIARLQLLRDLGILFIDETGMWKE